MGIGDYTTSGVVDGLDPEFERRLMAMIEANPRLKGYGRGLINDLYRSPEAQVAAINSVARRNGISIVDYARGIPGKAAGVVMGPDGKPVASKSLHGRGRAADFNWSKLTPEDRTWLHTNAPQYGLEFPESLRSSDPVHVQFVEGWTGTAPSGAPVAPIHQANYGRESGAPAGNAFASAAPRAPEPLADVADAQDNPGGNAFAMPAGYRVKALNIDTPDFGFAPRKGGYYG